MESRYLTGDYQLEQTGNFKAVKPVLAILICLAFGACATTQPRDPAAGNLVSKSSYPYTMAPLDKAFVKLPGGDEVTIEVSNEGYAVIGSGEPRRVRGMSAKEFRVLVRKSYPNAKSIEIEEFRPNQISVLGEVYHQLHTELTDGPMRLMDAIAGANGFTALANKRRVRLIRQNGGEIEVYEFDLRESMRGQDMQQNILLKPGDLITVPRNFL